MIWSFFVHIALVVIALWAFSLFWIFKDSGRSYTLSWYSALLSTTILGLFIVFYWLDINRPPMRTMAETRIWYSFLVGVVSLSVFKLYRSKNMLVIGLVMASVFLIVDIVHPEYHGKFLMPALQSPWFIPHVVSYMLAYALLASASLAVARSVYTKGSNETEFKKPMNLIYLGFVLLTIGMLLGAFWAKIAWGNYWAWDPKEVWALITWFFYLLVIHIHLYLPTRKKLLARLMILALIVLFITWLGIKYLPSANHSIHVYGS